jgi:hypothetical protein
VKRIVWGSVVVALAALGAYVWGSRTDDEGKIRADLARLAAAIHVAGGDSSPNPLLRGMKMRTDFDAIFQEDVRVNIPELTSALPTKRVELADSATQWTMLYRSLDVDFSDIVVKFDDTKRTAHVALTATLTAKERDGQLGREKRAVNVLFYKTDDPWRIAAVTVWEKGGGGATE